jgi:hydrogenase expression/formation protein HypE
VLWEESLPIREPVRGACELLGLDPLHIANEGQFLAVVAPELAAAALAALRATPGGEEAVIIGEVREEPGRTVLGVASYGGTRVIDMLVGDPLPRIC